VTKTVRLNLPHTAPCRGVNRLCLPTVNRDPATNPLALQSIGTDSQKRSWWKIDQSPRLYIAGNPFKKNSPWQAVSSTIEEVEHAIATLDPTPLTKEQQAPSFGVTPAGKKARQAAERNIPKYVLEERLLRHRLSTEVIETCMSEGREKLDQINRKRELFQKKRMRDARKAAWAAEAQAKAPLTRGSRLRSKPKQNDYVYAEDVDDANFEQDLADFNGMAEMEGEEDGPRKRRKRSTDSGAEAWAEGANGGGGDAGSDEYEEEEEDDRARGGRRSTRSQAAAQMKPARTGGRRSNRLRGDDAVEYGDDNMSAWGHSSTSSRPKGINSLNASVFTDEGESGGEDDVKSEQRGAKEEGIRGKEGEDQGEGDDEEDDDAHAKGDESLEPSQADHSSTPSPPSPLTEPSMNGSAE
jgi:hypothetical protein